ncbi:MAG TPA: hypothetical protein VGO23_13800 [Pseudonocardia sp.]|jgi:FAD/FMN-containing dehydrogenase|nr:hypothetical protein [Pseudonocardia sp.]
MPCPVACTDTREVRDVDPGHHADLFWAVRGGKGDFGIVTDIEFDLVPVARFHGGAVFFPAASTADVLHAWREWAPNLPEDTTTSVALLRLPPDPALPEPVRGQFVVSLRLTHLGTAEEGAALLAPMRAVATPLMDLVGELPYPAVDAVHMDPTDPMPMWDRGATVDALPAEAVEKLLAVAGPDIEAVRPGTCGGMINFPGHAGPDRVGRIFAEDDRARLLEIRDRHDPAGTFATDIVIG